MSKNTLLEITIYPVKSCKGICRDEIAILPEGPDMDRRWMIVDMEGNFLSQRKYSKLAMIHTGLDERNLFLSVPGQTPFMLPRDASMEPCQVQIWKRTLAAYDMGAGAADWLSTFLQTPCRLVFLPKDRPTSITFVDRMPLLLMSENSLHELNQRLHKRIRINRFRPNLVVSTERAFAEDSWKRIRIGDVTFRIEKPCVRCTVPCIDQETIKTDREPLETLKTFRLQDKGIVFGQLLVPENTGTIRRGEQIHIL